MRRLTSLAGKALGTLLLAGGFVLLVGRAPFVPDADSPKPIQPSAAAANTAAASFALPITAANALAGAGSDLGTLEPPFGLFKGRFGPSDGSPGFASEEHEVPGTCEGAGQRWAREHCSSCSTVTSGGADGVPEILVWMEQIDTANVTRAVTKDCTQKTADGVPVVATITFDDREGDANSTSPKVGTVIAIPLLPGATRTASLAVGDWLAVFDSVARPSTALRDMVKALEQRGWREVPSGARNSPGFEGERVLTNAASATCVISLSKQEEEHQLLTIVTPGARG
jgi:hypothetical protein